MRKIIIILSLLLLASAFATASQVTVGFENLQSVCGQQDYNGCQAAVYQPYLSMGLKINGGTITNQLVYGSSQSIFPFGAYYLNLNSNNGGDVTWDFIDPWSGLARTVYSVSFVVLGKNGDVIAGQRGSGASTRSPDPDRTAYNVVCNVASDCDSWRNGFNVIAYGPQANPMVDGVVNPIPYGEAGYTTSAQDFANIRVTLTVAPNSGGFTRLNFSQLATLNNLGQSVLDGAIAIDQITFDQAVPEPGTLGIAGCAIAGLLAWRRRRSTQAAA